MMSVEKWMVLFLGASVVLLFVMLVSWSLVVVLAFVALPFSVGGFFFNLWYEATRKD
jgi:hypothetical protein